MNIMRIQKQACICATIIVILIALSSCATMQVQIRPKQPYEVYLVAELSSPDLIGGSSGISLPEGKLFVIEHINGYVFAPSGQKPIQMAISINPGFGVGTMSHQLIPVFIGSDPNAAGQPDRYVVSQLVKWYASKGVDLLLVRTGSSGVMRANLTLTGYLVDSDSPPGR